MAKEIRARLQLSEELESFLREHTDHKKEINQVILSFLQEAMERETISIPPITGDRLKWFREALALKGGHEPSLEELRQAAQSLASNAIDGFIEQVLDRDQPMIL